MTKLLKIVLDVGFVNCILVEAWSRPFLKFLFPFLDLTKVSDLSSKLFIQCNTGICCVHVTRDSVNIYLCQSIGPCVSCLCLSVCV